MPRHLVEQIQSLANKKYPLETGGVLIGSTGSADGDDVVIVAIIGPGPLAHHTEISFEPDHEHQTQEIARIYRASNGVNTYLGDWHTHPNSAPDLSRRDKKTLKHIAAHREARVPRPIMAILGEGSPWMLKAWRLIQGSVLGFRRTQYCEMNIRETP
jgi:integrative and conjugative element protein (TIGR02256 family)